MSQSNNFIEQLRDLLDCYSICCRMPMDGISEDSYCLGCDEVQDVDYIIQELEKEFRDGC